MNEYVYQSIYIMERQREKGRERERDIYIYIYREREREREGERSQCQALTSEKTNSKSNFLFWGSWSLDSDWTADDYHVFDKNCLHFSDVLAKRITSDGLPQPLSRGLLDVTERMLDSLPEWRRALGRRVMNEVTRLVVVSWGKASKEKKEAAADKLGLDKGE